MTSATLASNSLFRLAFTTAVAVVISGCIVVPERNAVPESLVDEAAVTGFEKEVRYWGDEAPPYSTAWTTLSDEEIERRFSGIIGREHNYLALSGGGSNGAFGAGLLVGWTEHGDRPEFTIVTGISTGALIAPFAFLGS
ncbi:MAG: patatin-like phospholipase family protein, partial [Gammaproteobacteria bacterium]